MRAEGQIDPSVFIFVHESERKGGVIGHISSQPSSALKRKAICNICGRKSSARKKIQ